MDRSRGEQSQQIDHMASVFSSLLDLPEDVLAYVSASLSPRDLCNLGFTCKKLHHICTSDRLWLPHCESAVLQPGSSDQQHASSSNCIDLGSWWLILRSYKSIFRFILSVRPLLGIWVHQNPEPGNLVFVTWGHVSVVGCRIIPQELGPNGIESGLLWAPVFEIMGAADGSLAFFLHGREGERDCCYPGCFNGAKEGSNVLLLEAEPRSRRVGSPSSSSSSSSSSDGNICDAMGDTDDMDASLTFDDFRVQAKHGCNLTKDKEPFGPVSFQRLHFADRKKMLDSVARHVRLKIPQPFVEPMFPKAMGRVRRAENIDYLPTQEMVQKEAVQLDERRSLLLQMYNSGDPHSRRPPTITHYNGINSNYLLDKMCNPAEYTSGLLSTKPHGDNQKDKGRATETAAASSSSSLEISVDARRNGARPEVPQKLRLAKVIREKMKQIIRMGKNDEVGSPTNCKGNSGLKRVLLLQQFAKQGDSVALRLHARHWDLKTYRAWPLMPENRFAIYKMPEQMPLKGRELAGLWGGTFGWPPGKPSEDKQGKALYFLLLSYDETQEGRFLTATKILEGTHYVSHPNGSPMFTANVDEPSSQAFPWHTDRDSTPVDIVQAYEGEGIASGYGFRYPSSKPGDLFVTSKGLLAFVWREAQNVLVLQRLDLRTLLEKGDRVAALGPIANYAYLIKSLANVFAGFCGFGNRGKAEMPPV